MEERVTRLESHFEHIQDDIAELKVDIRRLDQKIDQKFEIIDRKFEKVDQRFDSLKDSVAELSLTTERSFHKLMLWGLTLYLALASGLLGVMAKGFGWIK